MNQGRRELVRFVRSLEAKENPRKVQDFTTLPAGTMVRLTIQRILQGAIGRFRRKKPCEK